MGVSLVGGQTASLVFSERVPTCDCVQFSQIKEDGWMELLFV